MSDYTTWIAVEKYTHVIHIDDNFTFKEEENDYFIEAIDLDVPKIDNTLDDEYWLPAETMLPVKNRSESYER